MIKKLNKKNKKNQEEKIKIENILKEKILKEKKLVVGVLGTALRCSIHGATIKNTLFEDSNYANILLAFNPTQAFLLLKLKIIIDLLWSTGHYSSYFIST